MDGFEKNLNLENVNFLVIDDSSFMRKVIKNILHNFVCGKVVEAPDGAEALKIMLTFRTDIIIVDLEMPVLDGLEFTKMLRADKNAEARITPIIMLTAHTERSLVVEARDVGVTEILAKPVSPENLYSRIAAVLENPRDFVECEPFTGHDRRRRATRYSGPDRRGG